MNKEKFIAEVLKIKASHTFKTSKPELLGFWFEGVEGEALAMLLQEVGVEASTESPCLKKYSPETGLTHEQAHASLTIEWTDSMDKKSIKAILVGVKKLRKISGWK